ncbi:penicillin-binding protein activator LpoB [Verrucomicrobiota bacterium]
MNTVRTVTMSALVCGILGCATPQNTSGYRPPDEEGLDSTGVVSHNYQIVLEKMVRSMLRDGLKKKSGGKPVIALGAIFNQTPYHIESRMIGEDIRIEVLKSGLAEFTTATDFEHKGGESRSLYSQLEFQSRGSGLVDPGTAKQYGRIVGADYLLFGNVYSMAVEGPSGRVTESNFKFNLTLTEIETGLVVWADTKQFRKLLR